MKNEMEKWGSGNDRAGMEMKVGGMKMEVRSNGDGRGGMVMEVVVRGEGVRGRMQMEVGGNVNDRRICLSSTANTPEHLTVSRDWQ